MTRGSAQNSGNALINIALLKALEKFDDIALCINTSYGITFKKKEAEQLLNTPNNDIANFKSPVITELLKQTGKSNTKPTCIDGNWYIQPLYYEDNLLGFIFRLCPTMQENWSDLLKLSETVHASNSLKELSTNFAKTLSEIIGTPNVFIALYEENQNEYFLPYFHDDEDERQLIKIELSGNSFTNFVRIRGKSLLIQKHEMEDAQKEYGIQIVGTPPESWLGVPIQSHNHLLGTVVVQSYDPLKILSEQDRQLIEKANSYLAEGLLVFKTLEEIKRHKELLEVSNTISKSCAFEYTLDNHSFYPIDKALDVLHIRRNKANYPFNSFLKEVDGKDRQKIEQEFLSLKKTENKQIEREIKLIDGKTVLKLFAFKPPNEPARTDKILGVIQDITQLKQNERVLKLAYDKVNQADKLKAEFMSALSYEIRTPINAIIGFSNLLLKESLPINDRQGYFKVVKQNCNSLIGLIDDIIDISRLESGKIKIHKNPTDLNRLLENIQKFGEKKKLDINKTDIELILHKSHKQIVLMTDETRLSQIIKTLVINAITYTDSGYVQFGYHIIDRGQPLVELFVKDTGSGIPTDKRTALFERYGVMKGEKKIVPGATSLGLSIAKDLMRLMGGEITVESTENQGTTFYFYLPYEPVQGIRFEKVEEKHLILNKSAKKLKILVADDNLNNYKLIEESFVNSKLDTLFDFAQNGLEAIEKLRLTEYDIILMDLKMPVMDGMQAADYIRKKLPSPKNQVPIVALTANALKETRRACLSIGFNGYITKPFLPEELVRRVKEVLA